MMDATLSFATHLAVCTSRLDRFDFANVRRRDTQAIQYLRLAAKDTTVAWSESPVPHLGTWQVLNHAEIGLPRSIGKD